MITGSLSGPYFLDQKAEGMPDICFVRSHSKSNPYMTPSPRPCPLYGGAGQRMPHHGTIIALMVSSLAAGAGGCAQTKTVEPCWTARPVVTWSRVVGDRVPAVRNGYKIVSAQPTVGLFPANLAVTRVAIAEDEDRAGEPMLFADPRNEFLQWNRAFDDQMAISEVFPIDQRDLGGGVAEPAQILAAFRGLHARLGLVYAVNELSPSDSEMLGAIYDTHSGTPVAVMHAQAQSVVIDEESVEQADPWQTDSRALVRKKFEKLTYSALHSLIVSDQPARSEPPAGWIPAGPIKPVEWPPRYRGSMP